MVLTWYQLQDKVPGFVAKEIYDIALKEDRYGRSETNGFRALLTSMRNKQINHKFQGATNAQK